jgi:PAS domain S-box-containing protein
MRILIADDHEMIRRGVRSLLEETSQYHVCGEAADGQDAIEKARQLKPDLILMDISMPNLNGLEATREIRRILPRIDVIILSQHEARQMVEQACSVGARGFVVKSSLSSDLLAAIEKVSKQQPFFSHGLRASADPNLDAQEIIQRSIALENALRESEDRFRSTFEQAAVGLAHVSPDGRWLRVNQKFSQIVGYSTTELLQLNVQDITHPDDVAEEAAEIEKILAGTSDHFSIEKRLICKDGSSIWVNRTVSAVRAPVGDIKYLISVVQDITSRKMYELAQFQLAAIVECSDDAIVSKDLNAVIFSWNSGAQRIFGYTPEEAIGKSINIIVPPELREEEKQIVRRLRAGERIDHFETIRVTKSGGRLPVSLSISPVVDSKGRVIGASKIARDITLRKQAEEALKEREFASRLLQS